MSSIVIVNKREHGRILFESIAVKKDKMTLLLYELKANGYTFDSKEGR